MVGLHAGLGWSTPDSATPGVQFCGAAAAPARSSHDGTFLAAAPGKTTIVEICDNGPLFELPAAAFAIPSPKTL